MDRAAYRAGWLSTRPDVSTHLVLTATMKTADLPLVAERFEIIRPSSLLFARVDGTASFGTAFSLPVRQAKPISFRGTGQEIPNAAAPSTKERMPSLWRPRTPGAKRWAA